MSKQWEGGGIWALVIVVCLVQMVPQSDEMTVVVEDDRIEG